MMSLFFYGTFGLFFGVIMGFISGMWRRFFIALMLIVITVSVIFMIMFIIITPETLNADVYWLGQILQFVMVWVGMFCGNKMAEEFK